MSWEMFWNASTAIGTVAMSAFTYGVIRQNNEQRRDNARPILILMPFDGIDPVDRSKLLSTPSNVTPERSEYSISLACVLSNIGLGPAINARLLLRFMNHDGYDVTRDLSPLSAGCQRGDAQHPMKLPVSLSSSFNEADFALAAGAGWVIALEYEDVYGNCFHTVHSKAPQVPWAVYGKGAASQEPQITRR